MRSWSFPPPEGSSVPHTIQFTPRFIVNSIRGAAASAVRGRGVTRMFAYHIADQLRDGSLQILLAGDEHDPVPVHLIAPHGRMQVPKVRAFVDFAVPRLKAHFAKLSREAGPDIPAQRSAPLSIRYSTGPRATGDDAARRPPFRSGQWKRPRGGG